MSRRPALYVLLYMVFFCWSAAQAQTAFSTRYSNTATNGDITLIGNVNLLCTTTNSSATQDQIDACKAFQGTSDSSGNVRNNDVYLTAVDVDANTSTTNSSSATLSMPSGSSVLFAGLYWSGYSTSASRDTVNLSTPAGNAGNITGSLYTIGAGLYQGFADVTAQVQAGGNGAYTVGNIRTSAASSGYWGAWTLVVAYRNAALPTRNLNVFDGFLKAGDTTPSVTTRLDIAVSGFLTPAIGTVNSTIGVVAYDGDRGEFEGTGEGGSLQFGPNTASLSPVDNAVNPVDDVFNSTISAAGTLVTSRNPSYANTLGVDIDTFTPNTPLPNGSTSAVVRVIGTGNDVIFPGVITLATDIFVPNIKDALTKTVTDVNGGLLVAGDELEYELVVKNQGNDGALNVVLTDSIPANTSFVPGSLVITGANAGTKTDAAGDDQAEFDSAGNRIVVRLGTGASAGSGGSILPTEESRVRFRVKVNTGVAGGTVISNSGQVNYRQQTLGTLVTDISDSNAAQAGDQPATISVSGPDLTLDKAHVGNFNVNTPGTFTLRVSNAGPAPSTGLVTVSDTLPAGVAAQSISGNGWTCTLSPLQCTRSDAVAVGGSFPEITLTVVAASAGNFVNSASVAGGGESSAVTGNNSDTDTVTVVLNPPKVTLNKTVKNVTRGGTETTTNSALPGDIVEYCVAFQNAGGEAQNFVIKDAMPAQVTPLPDAYGPGLGLRLTSPGGTSNLTSVADTDIGSLLGQEVSLKYGTLGAGVTGKLCFQAQLK